MVVNPTSPRLSYASVASLPPVSSAAPTTPSSAYSEFPAQLDPVALAWLNSWLNLRVVQASANGRPRTAIYLASSGFPCTVIAIESELALNSILDSIRCIHQLIFAWLESPAMTDHVLPDNDHSRRVMENLWRWEELLRKPLDQTKTRDWRESCLRAAFWKETAMDIL